MAKVSSHIRNGHQVKAYNRKDNPNGKVSINLSKQDQATLDALTNRKAIAEGIKKQIRANNADPGDCCYLCDKKLGDSVHYDHVIPLKHSGPDYIYNLAPTCGPCNSKKSARHWGYSKFLELGKLHTPEEVENQDYIEDLFERMYWKSQELRAQYGQPIDNLEPVNLKEAYF